MSLTGRPVERRAIAEEHQQVGEVRRRARAPSGSARSRRCRRPGTGCPSSGTSTASARPCWSTAAAPRVERLEVADDRQHRRVRVGGAVPGQARVLGGEARRVPRSADELALAHPIDLLRRVDAVGSSAAVASKVRRELEDALHRLELQPEPLVPRQGLSARAVRASRNSSTAVRARSNSGWRSEEPAEGRALSQPGNSPSFSARSSPPANAIVGYAS